MGQLIVTAARVLVGPGGRSLTPGAVLVSGDTITAVGSPDSIAEITPREARRLDYPDATILPGLIDAHVHLAFDASTRAAAAVQAATEPELLRQMAAHAERLLDQGITTVRDLGDRDYLAIALREQIARGSVVGPRILSAGAPLTTQGGHCWFLGGEVSTADQIRAVIGRHAAAGADCIKVMLSGGRLTAGTDMWKSQFTPGQLDLIVAEAARVGLPVAAHAHGTASILEAAEAGVSTIEHCSWMTASTAWTAAVPRPDVVQLIADKGIAVCPTIVPRWSEGDPGTYAGYAEHKIAALECYRRHGVRIIAGTDAGAGPRATFTGYARHLDLQVDAGIPPAEVIDIATCEAAAALGIKAGTIRHGYSADLLVVHGNPLDDLAVLRDIAAVVARGHVHVPSPAKGRC